MGKRAINDTQQLLKTLIYISMRKKYDLELRSGSTILYHNDTKRQVCWKNYKNLNDITLRISSLDASEYQYNKGLYFFYIDVDKFACGNDTGKLLDEAKFLMNTGIMI